MHSFSNIVESRFFDVIEILLFLYQFLKKAFHILLSFWLLCFFTMPISNASCATKSNSASNCCKKSSLNTKKSCCSKSKANEKSCSGQCCKNACQCSSSNIIVALETIASPVLASHFFGINKSDYFATAAKSNKGYNSLWTLPKIG